MRNERRTPEKLFHEITDYLITGYDTENVRSITRDDENKISRLNNVNTVTGTVCYDFKATFSVRYDFPTNTLSLTLTSQVEANDSTATIVYTMPGDSGYTVQIAETWDNKDDETEIKTYDNRDFNGNVSLGMSYVNLILAFIENLA